jgi:hypothetical protein
MARPVPGRSDLIARDIQHGHDHRVADYKSRRAAYGHRA